MPSPRSLAAAASFAAALSLSALAQTGGGIFPGGGPSPTPAPEPAPAAPAAGVIQTLDAPEIARLLQANGLKTETVTNKSGRSIVVSKIGRNGFYVMPIDCSQSDPNVGCTTLALFSGPFKAKLTAEQIVAFNDETVFNVALPSEDGPQLRMTLSTSGGVTTDWFVQNVALFGQIMEYFGNRLGQMGSGFSDGAPPTADASAADVDVDLKGADLR